MWKLVESWNPVLLIISCWIPGVFPLNFPRGSDSYCSMADDSGPWQPSRHLLISPAGGVGAVFFFIGSSIANHTHMWTLICVAKHCSRNILLICIRTSTAYPIELVQGNCGITASRGGRDGMRSTSKTKGISSVHSDRGSSNWGPIVILKGGSGCPMHQSNVRPCLHWWGWLFMNSTWPLWSSPIFYSWL